MRYPQLSPPVSADRHIVHTSMYWQLRTNLPRELMSFLDFPFDSKFSGSKDPRQFPSHQEVLAYIQAYAAHFNLLQYVQFGSEVLAAQPPPPAASHGAAAGEGSSSSSGADGGAGRRWRLTVRRQGEPSSSGSRGGGSGTSEQQLEYDAVVVCNGHYTQPRLPEFPGQGSFPGRVVSAAMGLEGHQASGRQAGRQAWAWAWCALGHDGAERQCKLGGRNTFREEELWPGLPLGWLPASRVAACLLGGCLRGRVARVAEILLRGWARCRLSPLSLCSTWCSTWPTGCGSCCGLPGLPDGQRPWHPHAFTTTGCLLLPPRRCTPTTTAARSPTPARWSWSLGPPPAVSTSPRRLPPWRRGGFSLIESSLV